MRRCLFLTIFLSVLIFDNVIGQNRHTSIQPNSNCIVEISITASENSVCAGTSVTFSSLISNGGSAPVYQWYVNGIGVGTLPTFTYIPENGNVVTCQLTSNAPCTGSPATSNAIVMIVNPNNPAGITISSSSNPVCQGSEVIFTAIPTNGGSSPSYQWKVNGNNAGTNNAVFSYVPLNGDAVSCVLTSNEICTTNNPAISNSITMTVSPILTAGVSIVASANPSCQGSLVTFTAIPVNGGASPIYQWNLNGIPIGTNTPTYITTPADGDIVSCQMISNSTCVTGNPALSNLITMAVSQNVLAAVGVTPSMNPVCSGNPVTFTAIPVNGGMAPIYQWFVNGFPIGVNLPSYTYIPANGDIVKCQLTSNLPCVTGNPAISNEVVMTVNTNHPVSVSITSSANPVCQGMLVNFTAIPNNGGTSPIFEWKVNGVVVGNEGSTYSYIPLNGDVVICKLTSSESCSSGNPTISNAIVMTVSPYQTVGISITASSNPTCEGNSVNYSAIQSNGGLNPVYQWKVNGLYVGTNMSSFTYTPLNSDVISCILTSNATCPVGNPATSNEITMSVGPIFPVSLNIAASSNPACNGQTVTFTATAVNGGIIPVYQWSVNGINVGTNNAVYSYIPLNGDVIICHLTSDLTCTQGNPATSNAIAMSISSFSTVSASISSSNNPVCQGSPVTFTSMVVNGGAAPTYQWKIDGVNSGLDQPTFTYIPVNGEIVTCQVTSSLNCTQNNPVTSNAITMSVLPTLPASVVISVSSNPVCTGNIVTFTATPSNGGSAPVYQWKLNGVNAGSNSSTLIFTPVNGDIVTCQLTSSMTCVSGNPAQSNQITMVVGSNLATGVSISASSNPFCEGTQVTYTASPINGGSSPTFQWKINGVNVGTNSPTYTHIPLDRDFVTCRMISNLSCAILNPAVSNPILMSMNTDYPVSVSISASENPVCPGTIVTFQAIPSHGGVAPVYQWKVNGTIVGTNVPVYSYPPANGDIITCQLLSNEPCCSYNPATSNQIIMGVSTTLPASINIGTLSNPACIGESVNFHATISLGGSSPFYQWKVNGLNAGTNSPNFSYTPLNGDLVTCELTSNATCLSGNNPVISNVINMEVSPALPVSVSIQASLNPSCYGTPVMFTASVVNGGPSVLYQWKVNAVNNGTNDSVFTYIPTDGDIVTCQVISSLSCAVGNPANSDAIIMEMTPLQPISIAISASANPVCQGLSATFMATVINGGSSPVYLWRVNGLIAGTNSSAFTYIPSNADAVTCQVTSNVSCPTANPSVSNQIYMVVRNVNPVNISISTSSNPFCLGSTVLFTATQSNPGSSPIYQWKVNGVDAGTNDITFTYSPLNGDIVTCQLTSSDNCVSNNPAVSNEITMVEIASLLVSVVITVPLNPICAGTLILFTATPTNGGTAPVYQWKVNGVNAGTNSRYFQYYPVDGDMVTCQLLSNIICASGNPANSNIITMTVIPVVPVSVSIVSSANPTCFGSSVSYIATPTNEGSTPIFRWKVNGVITGSNSPTFSYTPANNDIVTCQLTSSIMCVSGNPSTSNQISMEVQPYLVAGVSVTASANTVCTGTQVTFTATASNGGTSPLYQWRVNGLNVGTNISTYAYTPLNGDIVDCQLTSNALCVTNPVVNSNIITLSVAPYLPVSLVITASLNPVCQGTAVNYIAVTVNGGSSPTYQWSVNGEAVGLNNPSFTYTPLNGDIVGCQVTSNATCTTNNPAASNEIIMNVFQNQQVEVTISASSDQVCQGQAVTLTATPIHGGTNPVFQWKVNEMNVGTNSSTYTYNPSNGDLVACQLFSDIECSTGNPAISNLVTIIVNPYLSPDIAIISSSNPVCTGTPVTFTAETVNGGVNPYFEWKVNGVLSGTNQTVYTYLPLDGDVVTCTLFSGTACPTVSQITSNPIVMAVLPLLSTGISIEVSINPVCTGTLVSFLATPVNGGTAPVYQWKVNGINMGTNAPSYSYIPVNGDIITCNITSNATCLSSNSAISNDITMVVSSDLPVSIDIAASANPGCQGTPVSFTSNAVNGGTSPIYNWFVNNFNVGTNSPTYSYVPSGGDVVSCMLTSNFSCASGNPAVSNPITMQVDVKVPVSVTITASSNPACTGTSVTFSAYPVNGGSSPLYQWFVNGVNTDSGQSVFSYIPLGGDIVTCQITSNADCILNNTAMSNQIVMILSTELLAGVFVTASENSVCQGTSVLYSAVPTNGGSNPSYQWKVNGNNAGADSPSFVYSPQNSDVIQCVLTSNLMCVTGNPATSNFISAIVNPLNPVSIAIESNISGILCEGTDVTFTAVPSNGGTLPNYQWQINGANAGGNSPVLTYPPANGDIVTCLLTSNALCPIGNPALSDVLPMNVSPLFPVDIVIATSTSIVCQGIPVIFSSSVANGGTLPLYQWKVNNIDVGASTASYSYMPVNGDQVSCKLTSNISCPEGNPALSNVILLQVNPVPQVSLALCNPIITRDTRPFTLKSGVPLGGTFSGTGVLGNQFDPDLVPGNQTSADITYSYTNVDNCVGFSTQTITIFPGATGFICGQPFIDVRDNQSYQTVLIGSQCWMNQNLNYGTVIPSGVNQYDNCTSEKYCFSDDLINCASFGALYQWDELMQYEVNERLQGLCPSGWHIPAESDWQLLFSQVQGVGNAGDSLKSNGSSGFEALLPGVMYLNHECYFGSTVTFFWTSTLDQQTRVIAHGMHTQNKSVSLYNSSRANSFSVRCIKE